MIEVERKFSCTPGQRRMLVRDAQFISRKVVTDIYYDGPSFSLTTRDSWLRQRDGRFELKLPLHELGSRTREDFLDQYEEVTDPRQIQETLKLPPAAKLDSALQQSGLQPFATVVTTRKKYKKGKFIIDIDTMDFGYDLVEIELLVHSRSAMKAAVADILSLAKQYHLKLGNVRDKIIEYIRRKAPEHYQALVRARVVPA